MRLIVAYWPNAQTTTNRQSTGGESTADRCPHHRYGRTACRPSGAAPRGGLGHAGANRCHLGCGSSHRGSIAATLPPIGSARRGAACALGRPTPSPAQRRARGTVPGPVGRTGQAGGRVGALADPRGLGPALGSAGGRLGGVATVGPTRLAQSGARYPPPQERSGGAAGVEKNSPKRWLPS